MTFLPAFNGLPRQSLLEARRSGVVWLALGALIAAALISQFMSSVALSEAREIGTTTFGALLRLSSIFIVSAHVITSTVREHHDKAVELYLAQPISRGNFYCGRFLGHSIFSTLLALAYSVPLCFLVSPGSVAPWTISLVVENIATVSACLFFSTAFAQVLPSLAAFAGLYILGRSVSAVQSLAHGSLADSQIGSQIARMSADAAAVVLPRFDLVTRSEWLVYGSDDLIRIAEACGSLALYAVLLGFAGVFDLYRRNL